MTPHSTPTDDLDIPENFSPDRPPTLNKTICGCKCGCASCRCDDSGGDISPTSDFGGRGDEHCLRFGDLVARLNELNLAHAEQPEALRESPSGFSHATTYQVYSIDPSTDPGSEGDADANISQFRRNLCIRNEPRSLPDLSIFHTYPRNLDDLIEVPSVRPHSPGGDSLLVNPSEGEHSLISSMTSSIQLSKRGVSPGYFTIGVGGCFDDSKSYFLVRPLELTESLQHNHHCGHGVVCCSSSLARETVAEGPGPASNDSHDELG